MTEATRERIQGWAESGNRDVDHTGHESDSLPDLVEAQRAADAMRGSTAALREVWQQHRRWVAGVLLAHKPRDVELEDLLQDVALSMVKRISDLRDPAAVRPWLRQVAINVARASGRRQQVRQPERRGLRIDVGATEGIELATPAKGDGAGAWSLDGAGEGARLLEIARQLPDGYGEPLILRCVRGMSYREIGRVMELPETTVETRIARARRMVRERVAGQVSGSASGDGSGTGSGAVAQGAALASMVEGQPGASRKTGGGT